MRKRKFAIVCVAMLAFMMLFTGCIDKGEPYLQPNSGGGTGATEGIQASPELYAQDHDPVFAERVLGGRHDRFAGGP